MLKLYEEYLELRERILATGKGSLRDVTMLVRALDEAYKVIEVLADEEEEPTIH